MGNACSCVSKNKEPVGEENQTIKKEENGNPVTEEIKKETTTEQNAEPKPQLEEEKPKPKRETYPEPPEDFKIEVLEPVGKDVVPEENELPNIDSYEIPPKQLDDVAMELVNHNFPSFNSLIYHLIYKRPDNKQCNEFEKVCALFTWLTTKNLHDLKKNSDDIPPDTPESVLLGISNGKTAYAQVFQMLCRHAGLQCKLIRGYAKGVDYKPGMKLGGGKEAQHAWNSVKIDNVWYLFDCHWAARRLMGKSVSTDRVKYDLDLFYFMTNPLHLRYTHYPFDENWQLVKNKITLEDFENLTLIKPTFFKYNLELYSHNNAVLDVQNKLVLKLKIPKDIIEKICLTFTLTLEGLGEIYEGSNLTRYGMQEINEIAGLCTLNFRFPKSGTYKLLLYAREFGDQIFGGICEYRINCKVPEKEGQDATKPHEEKVQPYPPTQQPSYGKTEMAAQYNLKCLLEDCASLRISDGEFEVSFCRKDNSHDTMPRLMARLKSCYHDDAKLTGRILQRNTYTSDNIVDKFIVLAFLPDAGEYALEIYANNPEKEGSSFFLVWQLLVSTDQGTELPKGLPDINPGAAVGAQPQFNELGLICQSHSDPYIIVKKPAADQEPPSELSDSCVVLDLSGSKPVKCIGQLVDVSSTEEEIECSDYLLQQNILSTSKSSDESISDVVQVKFHMRYPRFGCFYKLHIYAALSTNETETLPMVFSYLINVPERLGSSDQPYYGFSQGTYPFQLSQWKEKCRLFNPINRAVQVDKSQDTTVPFKLQVPGAHHVAVVVNNETWTQLSLTTEEAQCWTGDVTFNAASMPNASKVAICVCYSSTVTSYNTILEYKIAIDSD